MNKTNIAISEIEDIQEEYPIMKIDEVEYCKLNVNYEGDPEIVSSKINEAIISLRKVKIPGFRKGKASDQAIKIRLKPQIDQFVARSMASHAVDDIIFETNIKTIGQPIFSNVKLDNKKFTCDIEIWKKPEFELGQFKFEIPKPSIEFDEESLAEKSLYNLRLKVGEVEMYDENDSVELGDQVTMSFSATIDGDIFDGSIVEGEMYTIGTNKWSGFDNYLLGMKAEETRKFSFVFENGVEQLEGKTAEFLVTIHMGSKVKPHPINDEFYNKMGVNNLQELMNKLKSISKLSIQRKEREALVNQVIVKLIEAHDFKVPQYLIDIETSNMANNYNGDNKEELINSFKDKAEKNIKLSLILDSIRESEPDSVLNDGEARNGLINHPSLQGQDLNKLFKNQAYAHQLYSMMNSLKEEFTLNWIVDQSTIIE